MTEQTTLTAITITAEAADEIRRIRTANQIPENLALRVAVKNNAEGRGTSYVLGFDETSNDHDRVFQTGGLTVFIDAESLAYLSGSTIGFSSDPEHPGLYFDNPSGGCGCGCGCSEEDCGNGGCADDDCGCGH